MLRAGAGKAAPTVLAPVVADAMALPVTDDAFDGAIVGFGIRNVADLGAGLREVHRVLRPGARFVILEFSTPRLPLVRAAYLFYFHRILPLIGRLVSGHRTAYTYLPRSVAHNDFIFAVIAEEKGFLGSLTVLGLFGIVLFNGIRIADSARDRLGTLLAIGVTALFGVHVFVNIAMTIGLVPITGIPLPLISYGGSFVLSCCMLQGLVQSVWRFRREFA